uniref:Uncharacterized protein n=1 Tax=Rhizophora mucronata TaxID=61149 RepID=A0A2P2NNP4_RHIMU
MIHNILLVRIALSLNFNGSSIAFICEKKQT